jgi:hypothetical protein
VQHAILGSVPKLEVCLDHPALALGFMHLRNVFVHSTVQKDGDCDYGKEVPGAELKAQGPGKVLNQLHEGEKVLDFWNAFQEQMRDWNMGLQSLLARENFESAVGESYEARNVYVGIQRRFASGT